MVADALLFTKHFYLRGFNGSSQRSCEADNASPVPVLQMKHLRTRAVKVLTEGHTSIPEQSHNSNTILISELVFSIASQQPNDIHPLKSFRIAQP